MPTDYLFVSCDIVGHSGESSLGAQRKRIADINRLVATYLSSSQGDPVVWASGGDGGHVAFEGTELAPEAVRLIVALKRWSSERGVPLRVVASTGVATRIEGADGRVQLVGHGINLAGRLLRRGDHENVMISRPFRELIESAGIAGVQLHDDDVIELPYFGPQPVCVMSVSGEFDSPGMPGVSTDDRIALDGALARKGASLEALYRAKRLLQLNPEDHQASNALLTLAERRDLAADGADVAELILDRDFGGDFLRGAHLLERRQGDLICRLGEHGASMFLVLRGELGGFATSPTQGSSIAAPDFRFTAGALVGELAFALKRPRTATIWCLQDSALLAFSYSELISSSANPETRKELEEAVNRTIRVRIVEHVGRTAPYLAGPGGPLDDTEATWARLRRGSRLISRRWRENPRLTPSDDAVREPGLYILISGTLELEAGTTGRLDGDAQPLVYADVPDDFAWKTETYVLGSDVMLLAVHHDVLLEFGPAKYRQILGNIKAQLPANGRSTATVPGGRPARDGVFVSYSHSDRAWLDLLKTHLEPYVRDAGLNVWSDDTILPGARWVKEVEAALASARVAVLIVSPHFLASRFIAEGELPPIFHAAEQEGLTIVWIPVRHSAFEQTPIRHYQAAHNPARPLDGLRPADRNRALVRICKTIADAASPPSTQTDVHPSTGESRPRRTSG